MPRRFVVFFAIGLAAGAVLGEFHSLHILISLAVGSLVVLGWFRRGALVLIMCLAALVGVWRTEVKLTTAHQTSDYFERSVELTTGVVTKRWTERGTDVIEAQVLHLDGRAWPGTVRIRLPAGTPQTVGDRVAVRCRWESAAPERQNQSAAQGLISQCLFPETFSILGRSTHWRARLALIRWRVQQRLLTMYRSPQADLLVGILLGSQETMTQELRAGFRATGTSHIVALSGFNVTIIITVMSAALTWVIGRRPAYWPIVALVAAFVVMTGASASVTRAGVMALVVLTSAQLGRPMTMLRLLAYVFIGMVITNPLIVRYDLGFQLSFLATIGLVYVSGGLAKRWGWLPEWFGVRENLSSTMAAMMVTEPLLLWTFGRLSIVAPFVNLAVLPWIPLIMATGTVSIFLPGAGPVTDALLRLVIGIIDLAAGWTFAQVMMPWWATGALAATAVFFVIRLIYDAAKKTSLDR